MHMNNAKKVIKKLWSFSLIIFNFHLFLNDDLPTTYTSKIHENY